MFRRNNFLDFFYENFRSTGLKFLIENTEKNFLEDFKEVLKEKVDGCDNFLEDKLSPYNLKISRAIVNDQLEISLLLDSELSPKTPKKSLLVSKNFLECQEPVQLKGFYNKISKVSFNFIIEGSRGVKSKTC